VRHSQIFEHFVLEISVPFYSHPSISKISGSMVRLSEIEEFPDFLGPFPRNCRTISPRFENFEIFRRMESAPAVSCKKIVFFTI